MPVGICVILTALSVVLTDCPPGPPALKTSILKSESFILRSTSSASGSTATVRWNDSGEEVEMDQSDLRVADDQIVSGRIDLGRCMFCGLCMEACGFTSFFMTNEYDGMSAFSRQELWFDASRTRVLPSLHQEAVDTELAKRATKERTKRAKKAAKAASANKAEEGA